MQDAGEVFGPAPTEGGLDDEGGRDNGAWCERSVKGYDFRVSGGSKNDIPKQGPPTTAIAYPAIAIPLQAGLNKSPSTPPVFVTGALAKNAPKNLVNMSVWKSFEAALPKLKQLATNIGVSTASLRP